MNLITWRGGRSFPLALIAIRTMLPVFSDHEDGEAVSAHIDSLRLLVRERSDIDRGSGAQFISCLEKMCGGDHIAHE